MKPVKRVKLGRFVRGRVLKDCENEADEAPPQPCLGEDSLGEVLCSFISDL